MDREEILLGKERMKKGMNMCNGSVCSGSSNVSSINQGNRLAHNDGKLHRARL